MLNFIFTKRNLAYILKVQMLQKVTKAFLTTRDLLSIFAVQQIDCGRAEICPLRMLVDFWVWSVTTARHWLVVHEHLWIGHRAGITLA